MAEYWEKEDEKDDEDEPDCPASASQYLPWATRGVQSRTGTYVKSQTALASGFGAPLSFKFDSSWPIQVT
jgi:hypothetical protein